MSSPRPAASDGGPAPAPGDLCILLMNGTAVCLPTQSQSQTQPRPLAATAGHLLQEVCRELDTWHGSLRARGEPRAACEQSFQSHEWLFALWICSPLLELQLRPSHRPFAVLAQWDQYLHKYAALAAVRRRAVLERDEPVLSLQRSVFARSEQEMHVENPAVLELLYEEAKVNVLEGRYPLEDYAELACLAAALQLGPFQPLEHTVAFFQTRLSEWVPLAWTRAASGARASRWSLPSQRPELALCRRIVDLYAELPQDVPRPRLLRKYLECCWALPVYGSAFFSGQIERHVQGMARALLNHFDCKVWVAVNWRGLHLVDKERSVSGRRGAGQGGDGREVMANSASAWLYKQQT